MKTAQQIIDEMKGRPHAEVEAALEAAGVRIIKAPVIDPINLAMQRRAFEAAGIPIIGTPHWRDASSTVH